jgi:cytochrome oxidase Cu insertion factor (SCO1/SenC/PrrC family)
MLLMIAALFLLPLILAWLMYSGTLEFRPESTRNKGTLVQPPVPIDLRKLDLLNPFTGKSTAGDALLEHWVVLYPLIGRCGPGCLEDLANLRQIHLASGRHQGRIRLAIVLQDPDQVSDQEAIDRVYDQFIVVIDSTGRVFDTIESIARLETPESPTGSGSTYLIDPLGNIMMVYAPAADPSDLKEDLKRLLTWSKLDEQQ